MFSQKEKNDASASKEAGRPVANASTFSSEDDCGCCGHHGQDAVDALDDYVTTVYGLKDWVAWNYDTEPIKKKGTEFCTHLLQRYRGESDDKVIGNKDVEAATEADEETVDEDESKVDEHPVQKNLSESRS